MIVNNTVLVVGLGNLSKKLIVDLCQSVDESITVVVLTRDENAKSWCDVVSVIYQQRVEARIGSAVDEAFLEQVLQDLKPRLILQCASLLSPFCFDNHPLQSISRKAGFALQLPAQLIVAMTVSRVAARVCPRSKVVNCSFPDVVNPILHNIGYTPVCGIGNAGIVQLLIERNLTHGARAETASIRVFAHHVHAISILKAYDIERLPDPIIYMNDEVVSWKTIKPHFAKTLTGELINMITAASAKALIHALVDPEKEVVTSVAGPLGLQGGHPIQVRNGEVSVLEVDGLDSEEIEHYYRACARLDGVEAIESDGTVRFTDSYIETVRPVSEELCKPLRPEDALQRFELLTTILEKRPI